MRLLALTPLVLMVACATPQEQCVSQATRDLRINASLIAETEGNLARGFGLRTEQRVREVTSICRGVTESGEAVRSRCEELVVRDVRVPVALDLAAERAKLASLRTERDRLQREATAKVGQCRAQFPDG